MNANGECIVNEFLDEHRTLVMTYTIQVTLSTEDKYLSLQLLIMEMQSTVRLLKRLR